MTTNSKDYMREYQRKRRAKIRFVKNNVKIVKKSVKISELNPPKVGKSVESNVHGSSVREALSGSQGTADPKTFAGIDFQRIADLSSFRMFIQEVIKTSLPGFEGVPTRGKKKVITNAFNKRIQYWKEVQEEMKIVLVERRKKNAM